MAEKQAHGKSFNLFMRDWLHENLWCAINLREKMCSEVSDEEISSSVANCRFAVYVRKREVDSSHLNFAGGQSVVCCPTHDLRLCVDNPKSKYQCSFPKCKCVSLWRCPQSACFYFLCKKHFKNAAAVPNQASDNVKVSEIEVPDNPDACASEEESDNIFLLQPEVTPDLIVSTVDDIIDLPESPELFDGPTEAAETTKIRLDTDAGVEPLPVDVGNEELKSVPIQALFNVACGLL